MISLGRRIIWVVLPFLLESGSSQRGRPGIFKHLQPVDATSALGGEANTWELWLVQLCGWESFLNPLWTPLTWLVAPWPLSPPHSSQVIAWDSWPGSELFLLYLDFKPSFPCLMCLWPPPVHLHPQIPTCLWASGPQHGWVATAPLEQDLGS